MSLTREQIEGFRVVLRNWTSRDSSVVQDRWNTLCDMALRALPAGEVVAPVAQGCPTPEACDAQGCRLLCTEASPAPVAAEPSGNPLLWNVHCMYQQAERDMGWHGQWRDLLAAIEQHLQRVGYPNPAPVNESNVDSQTSEGRGK